MKRHQFDGIIQHIEKDLEGAGYEIQISTRGAAHVGALLPSIEGRADIVVFELSDRMAGAPVEKEERIVYIDVEAIVAVRGPIL